VLLQHGLGGSKSSPYLDATAHVWVRDGAAVASIDFPLHGERASAKLGDLLAAPDAGPARALASELLRQAVIDLRRALDAAASLPEVDAGRAAYAGFSLGALVGATFCAVDPRPRAAALALAGGGLLPPEVDPLTHVARIAPRPLLLVGASGDRRVPRAATEALFAAAREPKRLLWFEATHDALPGRALKAMWGFLREALGLAG
jgi:dienelactone hydrolase